MSAMELKLNASSGLKDVDVGSPSLNGSLRSKHQGPAIYLALRFQYLKFDLLENQTVRRLFLAMV